MNEQKDAKEFKFYFDRVIIKQKEFVESTEILEEKTNISVCGIRNEEIHIYSMKDLGVLAKIYEKEIKFCPFNVEDYDFVIESHFYINDINIFSLGNEAEKKDILKAYKE